jgi:outer membrane protein assembly factor BamB
VRPIDFGFVMNMLHPTLAWACLGLSLASTLPAENWPHWRGPHGDGRTAEQGLPQTWSATQNVRWKTALPEPGNSTPVVWGNRLFLTQARGDQRLLQCYDTADGKLLWEQGVTVSQPELTHKTNPPCASSPTTDGTHVVVWFGSAGLHCFDFNGAKSWSCDLGEQRHIWGYGASPVLDGDRCFLNFGPGARQFLVCVDLATGQIRWRKDEPGGSSGEGDGKKWTGSWSDPLIRQVGDHRELIMTWPGRLGAYNPDDGTELWTCAGLNALVYTSPLFRDADLLTIGMGGYNGMAVAVKAGGRGDVTAQRLWQATKTRQRIGSGVIHGDHVYLLTDPGIAECRSLEDGTLVWEERLSGPGPTSQNWSSLVLSADGFCYAVNQGGDAFVFRAAPRFQRVATNPIGEKCVGSIAVSSGRLYLRSHRHLWCIGSAP